MGTGNARVSAIFRRWALGAAAALVLAGCGNILLGTDKPIEDPQTIVEATDWELAIPITIDIRQNTFTPGVVRLFQGEPYRIVLENRDDVTHVFSAPEFFRTTAIRKVVTEKGEEFPKYLNEVSLAPGAIKELHLVPVRDGWYDFKGAGSAAFGGGWPFFFLDRGEALGMIGRFIVEP